MHVDQDRLPESGAGLADQRVQLLVIGAPAGLDPALGLGAFHLAAVDGPPLRDDAGNHPQPRHRALVQRMARDAAHQQGVDLVGGAVQVDDAARDGR